MQYSILLQHHSNYHDDNLLHITVLTKAELGTFGPVISFLCREPNINMKIIDFLYLLCANFHSNYSPKGPDSLYIYKLAVAQMLSQINQEKPRYRACYYAIYPEKIVKIQFISVIKDIREVETR